MSRQFDVKSHPISVAIALRRRYGSNVVLRFSRYRDVPGSTSDPRRSFEVRCGDVSSRWLDRELAQLEPSEELALESRVRVGAARRHIPMLDLRGKRKNAARWLTASLLPDYAAEMMIYASGRSFHVYWPRLLSEHAWHQFLGSALLCNRGNSSIVDVRWVGHRLMGGYAALRWSCNTSRHRSYPTLVERLST
jgi:hypothetical protein